MPGNKQCVPHARANPVRKRHAQIRSPKAAPTRTISQLSKSMAPAPGDVISTVSRSAIKPLGDARPIAAIQSGNTASGKKLPPAMSSGNTSRVETMPATLWLLNIICKALNQANSATTVTNSFMTGVEFNQTNVSLIAPQTQTALMA